MKDGKAYAHKSGNRLGDLYDTPKSLLWVAEHIIRTEFSDYEPILEPCSGNNSIVTELCRWFGAVYANDLYSEKSPARVDYLKENWMHTQIITNPPFSLWDEFVIKAKTHCKKFMFIGRLNYLGTQGRLKKGLWDNLKAVYPFSRYVDYQTPYRTDGLFHVGCQLTTWFLWDMDYIGNPEIEILDVQKYAKLGAFNK